MKLYLVKAQNSLGLKLINNQLDKNFSMGIFGNSTEELPLGYWKFLLP